MTVKQYFNSKLKPSPIAIIAFFEFFYLITSLKLRNPTYFQSTRVNNLIIAIKLSNYAIVTIIIPNYPEPIIILINLVKFSTII